MTVASTPEERDAIRRAAMQKAVRANTRSRRRPTGSCPHEWTTWAKTGVLSSTIRRDCTRCGRIQVRYPNPPP